MLWRERRVFRSPVVVALLVSALIVVFPSAPTWSGSVAIAQAGCGIAAHGDDPGEDGFQIDGQFYSGLAADDWAQGASFSGVLLDDGTPDPAYEPALYARDEDWSGGGTDCSTFQRGTDSNNDDISPAGDPWVYGCGTAAQKYDLTDVYAHARSVEVDGSLKIWLVVGALTRSVQAESHLDFEWNVAGLEQVPYARSADGEIIGPGPHAGRTADVDFIVSVDFSGGAPPDVLFRKWSDVGGAYEYVLFDPGPGNAFVCVDELGAVAPPWGAVAPDGSEILPPGTITPFAFVEAGVELTSTGVEPADLVSEHSTLMFKNRRSNSFTSYLVDFGLFPFRFVGPSAGVDADERGGLDLLPPLPNPARAGAAIRFAVPADAGSVRLAIFSVSGRLVRTLVDGTVSRESGETFWDGADGRGRPASAGVYFVRLETAGRSVVQKLVLLR